MILTTHALTGAVIGKNIQNPWLVIILALVVHFIMDTLRHGEYFDDRIANFKNTWWKVSLDLLTACILILFVVSRNTGQATTINILIGSFFSLLPDGLSVIYYFSGKRLFKRIKAFHARTHRYNKFPKYSTERAWTLRNARNDIIISLVAITLLFL